jgi:hypothetical protein
LVVRYGVYAGCGVVDCREDFKGAFFEVDEACGWARFQVDRNIITTAVELKDLSWRRSCA